MTNFQTTNPTTGLLLENYSHWNDSEIEASLAKAETSYRHWRQRSVAERAAVLSDLGKVLKERTPALARQAVLEMGKPIGQARSEVEKCNLAVTYYLEHAQAFLQDRWVETEHLKSYVTHQPIGPVLCIMPWNFPYWQVFRFAIPALTAGNPVLLKHAENTTGVGLLIEQLMNDAGFPEGVFQTILANHDQTAQMIRSKTLAAVSLTGSERAGRIVGSQAGQALKKCVLELGGSDPYIVLKDADVVKSAETCMRSRLINNGQSCIAAKRFIVHEDVYDEFKSECIARAEKVVLGDPLEETTTVGPIAKRDILDETKAQVQKSVEGGASIAFKTESVPREGFFHPIVILENVKPGLPAFDDEVFAPVVSLIKFKTTEQAVALANQHRYGLGAAVFTKNIAMGETLVRSGLDAGIAAVNSMVVSDPRLPFGGIKHSGYGRELSREGILEFMNVKTIIVNN